MLMIVLCFFFCFQAEDGIRDLYVTGVQTCALPILIVRGLLLRRLTALSPRTEVQGMLCGISFGFPELFPTEGQIAHVLRTRAPCASCIATTAHSTCMC